MRRHYAMLRYGAPDLRLLTGADGEATRIRARFEDNDHTLLIDLSGATNASVRAGLARAAETLAAHDLYESREPANDAGQASDARYNKWKAAVDFGKHVCPTLTQNRCAAVIMFAVALCNLNWATISGAFFGHSWVSLASRAQT